MNARYVAVFAFALIACDSDKPAAPDAAIASATATVSAPPVASSAPPVVASAAPSAAPSSSTSMITGADSADVMLTEKDPTKEPEKSIKAQVGGNFTLFLPDANGTTWAADTVGTVGKPKEEVIPGFAPQTLGHQFKWTGLKAGKTKLIFGLRKTGTKGGAPTQTFTLNLEVS